MWVLYVLVGALGAATTSFQLKRAVAHGGAVASTVAARLAAGTLLLAAAAALGAHPPLTEAYWRAVATVLVPEVLGMTFLTLALREGELSLVQPLTGLLPPLVMAGGIAFLGEVPTRAAAGGVLLVTAGVYCVGLQPGTSALEPLRALARSRASWYAVASAVCWSLATLVHKQGIAAVGPLPWAATIALASGIALAVALPVLRRASGDAGLPRGAPAARAWTRAVLTAGVAFAVHQAGLHQAFRSAQAGYVMALSSTSILLGTALGVVVLRERSGARYRVAGALLVCAGATVIALLG
jgi:drug/metabolite transporter (DMT)-like permease